MDLQAVMTDLEPLLSLIGSICLVAGTVFVVVQLRMNAKQAASSTAFDLIGKVTDATFRGPTTSGGWHRRTPSG